MSKIINPAAYKKRKFGWLSMARRIRLKFVLNHIAQSAIEKKPNPGDFSGSHHRSSGKSRVCLCEQPVSGAFALFRRRRQTRQLFVLTRVVIEACITDDWVGRSTPALSRLLPDYAYLLMVFTDYSLHPALQPQCKMRLSSFLRQSVDDTWHLSAVEAWQINNGILSSAANRGFYLVGNLNHTGKSDIHQYFSAGIPSSGFQSPSVSCALLHDLILMFA